MNRNISDIIKEKLKGAGSAPEKMNVSIYEYISENIKDGRLPDGFGLPAEYTGEKGMIFAPGALEGIMLYSFGVQPDKDIDRIYNAITGKSSDRIKAIEKALGDGSALTISDALLDRLIKEKPLTPDEIHCLGISLAQNSHNKEAVKIGILLLEILDNEGDERVLHLLHTLGACDEFTLWSCFVLRHLKEGNEEIFRLAKNVNGWGKVFAVVDILEADNEEKRDWLLRFGCDNRIMVNYTALAVYRKGQLARVLSEREPESFDEEEVKGLADIALGLACEEPMAGASALDDPAAALGQLRSVLSLHPGNSLAARAVEAIDGYEYETE